MIIPSQAVILSIMFGTIVLFLWGRWRHDLVAMAALIACVAAGLVPPEDAFAGFGHPAVVTVACVLVLSRGVQMSGIIDALAPRVLPTGAGATRSIAALCALAALLSAFLNNVGALALLLPLGLQIAAREDLPPGKVLMPLAFASILGGMTTMIGTPPNLIVSGFRAGNGASTFGMFDFTPVGGVVAAIGCLFVVVLGRWLVPERARRGGDEFDAGAYLTEARITEKSKVVGRTLAEVEAELDELDAQVVGLIRREVRLVSPNPARRLQADDILVVEAEPEPLAAVLSQMRLELEEDVRERPDDADEKREEARDGASDIGVAGEVRRKHGEQPEEKEEKKKKAAGDDEIVLGEFVVMAGSILIDRSATDIQLRSRFGINLLAISRQGQRSTARLRTMPVRAGDVLLMQGPAAALSAFAAGFGCIPLATRSLRIPDRRRATIVAAVMILAIAGAAFGLVPASIAFAAGALVCVAFRVIPLREVYDAIDWPVIVLLAALIPVAGAVLSTGTADGIARLLLDGVARGNPVIALVSILVVTMTLSDFMNNAATAAVMCPIALSSATHLGVSADPFLMAVAVGASCAFLTPIGHQNNTLILGPGGFHFSDYWRLGLPLEILIVAVGTPMILLVWPL
jgi:di/tricarboxylate transporter